MKITASDLSYKTFCELVTGYRSLAVVMQAVDSGLVEAIGERPLTPEELTAATGMHGDAGHRFIELLTAVGVFEQYGGLLYLSGFSRRYLFSGSRLNQLKVLEFEKRLQENWHGLGEVLRSGQSALTGEKPPDEYLERLRLFHGAMHGAAAVRAAELWEALAGLPDAGLIIDIGAGDGTYLREFLGRHPGWRGVACDLADVLMLSEDAPENEGFVKAACNIADRAERDAFVSRYAGSCRLLLLSNLIHCYSPPENEAVIRSLARLPAEDGIIVIHDFFRDGGGFGAMYDIHMMVNTYNGRCYSFEEARLMLGAVGFGHTEIIALPTYSHAVIASRNELPADRLDPLYFLKQEARKLEFIETAPVNPVEIVSEAWVRAKCAYGCSCYGRKWSCPPRSMGSTEFLELLREYSKALLVVGQAPLKDFQRRLLELEKAAFLDGYKKALVFTGGPCCWCDECPDERCLFPEKRRPSLESCGCDVFALAESAGIKVTPLRNSDDFVQFIGLLLVE